jgi:ribosomal protein S16
MKNSLNSITRNFILGEGQGPTINSWIQALSENVGAFKPRTISEERRIEVMKHQLRELRRASRRMSEQINRLEEQVNILQEDKNDE